MDRYRIAPGGTVDLGARDPRDLSEFQGTKKEGRRALEELVEELAELQYLLWADDRHKVLVVFQAMDTGGKDGTIRRVLSGVNPQGVRVYNFKAPSRLELDHDYLWRIHARAPRNGEITVFNRSHYEDVLAVRVLGLVPEQQWRRRYDHINDFEKMLADEGTTILKFYLHISKEEQAERLQARLDDETKNWKFNASDLDTRAQWPEYVAAYEEAIRRTSTAHAPWYVVPADRKWYRDLVVASTIVEALRRLDMSFPEPEDGIEDIIIT